MTLTREQIYTIIREFNCGEGYDAYERANQATDEIWDLVEPTVREAKAEGWDDGKAAAVAMSRTLQLRQTRTARRPTIAKWATEDVRIAAREGAVAMGMLFVDEKPAARDEAVVSFDRWLAAHDAEVAAKAHMEALEEAASIAEWLEFGPAPAFSQPAAHKWGALKAAERIRARAAELTRDTPSR